MLRMFSQHGYIDGIQHGYIDCIHPPPHNSLTAEKAREVLREVKETQETFKKQWETFKLEAEVCMCTSQLCACNCAVSYRIVGNFRWVQIFEIFVDRPASTKI